jgi:iron complex transport system substrate-binding protein
MNRVIGLLWLSNLLYPNDFEFDMHEVTKEFFRKFWHYEMSDEETDEILNPKPL